MSDIVSVTKEVIELFEKHDLTRAQCLFTIESVKMQINEDIMRDIVKETKGISMPGVG